MSLTRASLTIGKDRGVVPFAEGLNELVAATSVYFFLGGLLVEHAVKCEAALLRAADADLCVTMILYD